MNDQALKTSGQQSNEERCPLWFVYVTLINKINSTESDCKDSDLQLLLSCVLERKKIKIQNTLRVRAFKEGNIYTTAANYRMYALQQYVNENSSSTKVICNSSSVYTNLFFYSIFNEFTLERFFWSHNVLFLIIYFWTLKN